MIQRYLDFVDDGCQPDDDGPWVNYSDHLAEIAKKDEEIKELKSKMALRFKPGNTKYKPLEPTYIDGRGTPTTPLEGNEE